MRPVTSVAATSVALHNFILSREAQLCEAGENFAVNQSGVLILNEEDGGCPSTSKAQLLTNRLDDHFLRPEGAIPP
jgi:hypothetical protein